MTETHRTTTNIGDGYNSGIGFGRYDVDRLIESIRVDLVERAKGNKTYMIAPTDASISPVEDFLLERYKLYKWLYFHHSIKFFNTCLVKAIESIILLKIELPDLLAEKFDIKYFHFSRYCFKDGFKCDEIWLWDVFYKAYIELKKLPSPNDLAKQAIVYLDVIINRAKRGFSIWKSHPQYLAFNRTLKSVLCEQRETSSVGEQYVIMGPKNLGDTEERHFFNTILNHVMNDKNKWSIFKEEFCRKGISVYSDTIKDLFNQNPKEGELVGSLFLSINKFVPFEVTEFSTPNDVVSKFEFYLRKPENGKKVIRLSEVSQLTKSLFEAWKSDIQCHLFFVISSMDYVPIIDKGTRNDLIKRLQKEFCKKVSKWLEEHDLIKIQS